MAAAPLSKGDSQLPADHSISSASRNSQESAAPQKQGRRSAEAEMVPGFWTTHLSSKGQMVIPEQIRKNFGLQPGDEFVVVAINDLVFLKRI
ncbi:AbrB/MazE/SpoVT family DNA-binding domain-containing protein [Methylacidimicrobium cyclopophantes]|nr:AbrB/MazE/SpoVT family DNA-binding domain-containing protein [Methylacidimicrobium cyclopophantes]